MRFQLTIAAVLSVLPLCAQEIKPAPVINIERETIKEGRTAAHEKTEADMAATFRRANYPGHYLALATESGANEVWFVQPLDSFAANEELDKAIEKEPLKSAYALVDARDGELRSSTHTMWAVYRPDLSYHPEKFNPVKTHYVLVSNLRVKLGHDPDFVQGAKMYLGALEKANIDECTLTYEVVLGAPTGLYLFFTLMDSMKGLDQEPAHMQAIEQAMGPENFDKFTRGTGDVFTSMEDTLLEVKPSMSYPPQQFIDADPGFWKPKPAVKTTAAAPPAPEKKQ